MLSHFPDTDRKSTETTTAQIKLMIQLSRFCFSLVETVLLVRFFETAFCKLKIFKCIFHVRESTVFVCVMCCCFVYCYFHVLYLHEHRI